MAPLQFSEEHDNPSAAINQNKQLLNNIGDGIIKTRPSALYAEITNLPDS